MSNPNPDLRVLNRVRSEFIEMPGLALKADQLQRLCGIDRAACEVVLDILVDTGFLAVRPDGSYARSKDGETFRARPQRATLDSQVMALVARPRSRAS